MSDTVIKADGLGKRYRIGLEEEKHDTLGGTIMSWATSPVHNYRRLKNLISFSDDEADVIWSLKDVSFEVKSGERVGIIGANGAGKSTLLKILSRITEPTTGYVDITGRVSSLLEIGTGFHPELTGRENTYLNGTIHGMSTAEVDRKLDEIVAFSGVERFIDTPVKRYSTGMRVRLAFSVAAHLEPDILLVDEVLAVGDLEFQKKCLGKMDNVARSGRTVLFISHNMAMVQGLCRRGILLRDGQIVCDADTEEAISEYAMSSHGTTYASSLADREDRDGGDTFRYQRVEFLDPDTMIPLGAVLSGRPVLIRFEYESYAKSPLEDVHLLIGFFTSDGNFMFACRNDVVHRPVRVEPGRGEAFCLIPKFPLNHGRFYYDVFARNGLGRRLDWVREAGFVDVERGDFFGTGIHPEHEKRQGMYVDFDFPVAERRMAAGLG